MHIIRYLPRHSDRPTAVAIGNFDGLHLGHRAVINTMVEAAFAQQLVPSVLTFEPHPRRFFTPDAPDFRITSLPEKFALLRSAGVRNLFVPRFDAALASMPAQDFLNQILGKQLNARVVVTGENFVFGHKRQGNTALLSEWGRANDVRIITVPPVIVNGEICSSSAVRAALTKGNVAHAATLLGRPYTLKGRVIHGQGRGAGIGFPTANVALPTGLMLPAFGVYAVRVELDGKALDGVANLGFRPTMGSYQHPTLEVHLFDTRQDIYGKTLQVALLHFLRPEQKFESVDKLVDQIKQDCEHAKQRLQEGRAHHVS